jgi:fido (protein-threonine AMPylation protein)
LLRDEVVDWLELNNRLKSGYPKEAHVMIEHIHPFQDGNGRVFRILYNIHRVNIGEKIQIIHADWPKKNGEQAEYYQWFA